MNKQTILAFLMDYWKYNKWVFCGFGGGVALMTINLISSHLRNEK